MATTSQDVAINFFSFPYSAYTALGILIAIIFILDGWRSSSTENASLEKSPKIRGLLYILGAGAFPGTASLFDENTNAIVIYTLVLCISIIVLLISFYFYALVVACKTHKKLSPDESIFIAASLTALTIVMDGIGDFKEKIELMSDKDKDKVKERNKSLDYVVGYYGGLIENSINQNDGVDNYLKFIDRYMETFIKLFLEKDDILTQYRGVIYYRDEVNNELRFLTGVAPFDSPHTREPLPLKGSFAGWVLLSGAHKAYYYSPKSETGYPFFKRPHESRYNSIIACKITASKDVNSSDIEMLLCIDRVDAGELSTEYTDKMIMILALSFAHAKDIMNINCDSIKQWVDNSL